MSELTFKQISPEMTLAIGDGLALGQHWKAALGAYRAALKYAGPALRTKLQVRVGLISQPKTRTLPMFRALLELEPAVPDVFVGEGLATWFKTLPFLEDARFMELAEKHGDLLPLPNWHWNLQAALWAVRQALQADGDLVELGVFRGHTTLFVSEYLGFADLPRKWFLFDTFDGIPDDQLDPGWAEANKATYKGVFSYQEVRDRFAHIPNVQVIKGRVPEILEGNTPERICFIHMDLNNATAEIQALDALFDRIVPGGVILFDDYCWAVSRAQHLAEREWFAKRGLHILPMPTGQGLFIKS